MVQIAQKVAGGAGRIEKLRAIAKAMNFPSEVKVEESVGKAHRYAIQIGQRCSSIGSGTTTQTWCNSSSP